MGKMNKTISLLPFIESKESRFLLDIPVLHQDKSSFQGYSHPFQIVDSGQNFSILVKAGLKVEQSENFKSLFLLVQRDNYPIHSDNLTPCTNAGIDRIWHDTIQSYAVDKNAFIVPEQLSRDGDASPFKSLYFCKKVKKFFHPPCPECGAQLELCTDDDLLRNAVLFPYSTSLRRYLFCPSCSATRGNSEFYQFSRSTEDQVFTKDRFDLIKDFNRLKSTPSGGFPCLDCPGYAECYITGEKAVSHISFFSFYPFHMLFFDAQPIKATDFIPFISGASVEEVSTLTATVSETKWKDILTAQAESGFFFKGRDKFFLEVLFLKLTFFESFICLLSQRTAANIYPFINISAQSIWIRPKVQGGSLPFFWDFKVSLIDLISNTPKNQIESALTLNNSLHFMASLWFYTFVVNKDQGNEAVYSAIGKLTGDGAQASLVSDYNALIQKYPAMAMENIFWNPGLQSVPQKWYEFWSKIILMGLGFFNTEKDKDLPDQLNELINEIAALKKAVKEDLFSKAPDTVLETPNAPLAQREAEAEADSDAAEEQVQLERKAISKILKKLKTQWEVQDNTPQDLDVQENTPQDFDDDVLETVVLSSDDETPDGGFDDAGFDDAIEETVIIDRLENKIVEDHGFDDLEETVIMSPGGNIQQGTDFSDDDDLDKTVVITPKK